MGAGAALRRLWRHAGFRRLLTLRALSQSADGTVQVGMAAYLLFSPASQPDAWSIAAILAITFLPFTLLGPFVSPLLDTWSRRQVVVVSDLLRAALSVLVGALILVGATTSGWQVALFAGLLALLSINRFMLAGLTAGLQHVVDEDEYLTASSILPMVGPMGVVVGALLGMAARLGLAPWLGVDPANAVVFWVAAALFLGSVALGLGFRRDALGPVPGAARVRARQVGRELAVALQHLAGRPVAGLAIGVLFGVRMLFGLFSVAVILAFRNLLNDDPVAALADLTLWGTLAGVGFIGASAVVPPLVRRLGLRWSAVVVLVVAAVATGGALSGVRPLLLGLSVLVGLGTQCYKIAADTFVQAHVAEEFKGRAFTFYDMAFNGAFVLAAVVAAVLLPTTGIGPGVAPGLAAAWLLLAAVFWWASGRTGAAEFEKGTEDLLRR
ncbi:MFS transporter [Arachnia propionica]|uniref:MFS transporter n=1 Tax=Arachnia propionica TaxID=1750 RepID=A0A3P1T5F3_9ACTN|nr:MFS transporter [Arachnia propionica]RRD04554.1 MFS transporter [Arachnia propionica]